MEKQDFKKNIKKTLIDHGFRKDGHRYIKSNEEVIAYIEIQKSNYDSYSYYLNYGFIINQGDLSDISKHYFDLSGRLLFDFDGTKKDLINSEIVDWDKLAEQLLDQIEKKVNFALKHGLKEMVKRFPELAMITTIKAKRHLGIIK